MKKFNKLFVLFFLPIVLSAPLSSLFVQSNFAVAPCYPDTPDLGRPSTFKHYSTTTTSNSLSVEYTFAPGRAPETGKNELVDLYVWIGNRDTSEGWPYQDDAWFMAQFGNWAGSSSQSYQKITFSDETFESGLFRYSVDNPGGEERPGTAHKILEEQIGGNLRTIESNTNYDIVFYTLPEAIDDYTYDKDRYVWYECWGPEPTSPIPPVWSGSDEDGYGGVPPEQGMYIETNNKTDEENKKPKLSIQNLVSTSDEISMDYTYDQGLPVGSETAVIEVKNTTTGEKGTYNNLVTSGSNTVVLNASTVSNVSFNQGDKFDITIYTTNAFVENVSITSSINLKVDPKVSINELKSTTDSIEATYTYEQGSPIDSEKAYLEVWNTTTNQKENIEALAGTNTIIFDDTNLNIDFNEGDQFKITIYTENASNRNDDDFGETQLLVSPKMIIEANYDDVDNPQNLIIKTYYKERNDADGVNLNIVVYDEQGNAIDNFIVNENQEIVIDLTSYENISWINANYTWTNNQQGYESIPSIIFNEYIGDGFELINNPPYDLNQS